MNLFFKSYLKHLLFACAFILTVFCNNAGAVEKELENLLNSLPKDHPSMNLFVRMLYYAELKKEDLPAEVPSHLLHIWKDLKNVKSPRDVELDLLKLTLNVLQKYKQESITLQEATEKIKKLWNGSLKSFLSHHSSSVGSHRPSYTFFEDETMSLSDGFSFNMLAMAWTNTNFQDIRDDYGSDLIPSNGSEFLKNLEILASYYTDSIDRDDFKSLADKRLKDLRKENETKQTLRNRNRITTHDSHHNEYVNNIHDADDTFNEEFDYIIKIRPLLHTSFLNVLSGNNEQQSVTINNAYIPRSESLFDMGNPNNSSEDDSSDGEGSRKILTFMHAPSHGNNL